MNSHWKCLTCQASANFSQFPISPNGWCANCGSKNLEVIINTHYICSECPNCKKVKDVQYPDLPFAENQLKGEEAKQLWINNGEWCACSPLSKTT